MNLQSTLEIVLTVPMLVFILAGIYAVTKWAMAQEYVQQHNALNSVIGFVNAEALVLEKSLQALPTTANVDAIKQDMITTAVNTILEEQGSTVKAANISTTGLKKMVMARMANRPVVVPAINVKADDVHISSPAAVTISAATPAP